MDKNHPIASFGTSGFPPQLERLQELISQVEAHADPAMRAAARELVLSVMELHGQALGRIVETLASSGDEGRRLLHQVAADPQVGSLLAIHGVHPEDFETRVRLAAARLNCRIVSVADGIVRIALDSAASCRSTAARRKQEIEDVLYAAAPDLTDIVILDGTVSESLVQLSLTFTAEKG